MFHICHPRLASGVCVSSSEEFGMQLVYLLESNLVYLLFQHYYCSKNQIQNWQQGGRRRNK